MLFLVEFDSNDVSILADNAINLSQNKVFYFLCVMFQNIWLKLLHLHR